MVLQMALPGSMGENNLPRMEFQGMMTCITLGSWACVATKREDKSLYFRRGGASMRQRRSLGLIQLYEVGSTKYMYSVPFRPLIHPIDQQRIKKIDCCPNARYVDCLPYRTALLPLSVDKLTQTGTYVEAIWQFDNFVR
jgi:hypothetical protein